MLFIFKWPCENKTKRLMFESSCWTLKWEKHSLEVKSWRVAWKIQERIWQRSKSPARRTHYDYKRKKPVSVKPEKGFLVTAVREFYSDLADVKDDNNLSKALKFAKRYEKYV